MDWFPSAQVRFVSRALAVFLTLTAFGAAAGSAHAQPIRITYLTVDSTLPSILSAWRSLLDERPDIRDRVRVTLLTESLLDVVDPQAVLASDVLIFNTLDQETPARFEEAHDVDLVRHVARRGLVLAVDEGPHTREHYVDLGAAWDERARAFWRHSSVANQSGLLKYVLSGRGIPGLAVPDPAARLEAGYYHPDAATGESEASPGGIFASWEAFDAWRRRAGKLRPGAARIAVGVYPASVHDADTMILDAVIAEVERQGAEAIPVFGYPAGEAFESLLRGAGGTVRADVALAFLFRFAGPDAGESLRALGIPVLNLIKLWGRSEVEWRASSQGLSLFEGTFQVFAPEMSGLVAPTVVGSRERRTDADTGLTIAVAQPMAARVRRAVRRAIAYASLASTPEADKRVAILLYNYPPGKASIGASYLNVAESISNILQRMRTAGYDVGGAGIDLSASAVVKEITTRARNVGGYAPGQLDALIEQGGAVRVPLEDYLRWLDGYPPAFRAKVIADWGDPADARVMAAEGGFVIPAVRYGSVVVLPQPARGWGEDTEKLYHAKDLAPHHQYVAAYSWLRAKAPVGFGAQAVIHLGTHGTLEWLDGKDLGLSEDDAPDALIGDLPNLNVYNVDVVGEGLVARRRGMAALVDHMVPPFRPGGLLPELAKLAESVDDYHNNLHKNVRLTEAYADQIRRQATNLGMVKDLGVDLGTGAEIPHETALHAIEDYLIELRGQNVPYGLHAFGRTPEPEMRESTVEAIVSVDRSLLPHNAAVLAAEMERRIVESGPRELDHLMGALDGRHVAVGVGGEPIRNPDVYPTGKNFYGIDPAKVPKPAAWKLGVDLAEQMLAEHLAEHGRYPEKVSFYVNPTWIEGMQREGYAGASEMRRFVEYLWGWDATVPETVDDAMWNESFAVYVEDRYALGLKDFFDEHSPHAYQDITGRMVETIRKDYWAADDATTERLLREHVESVAAHGVGCSSHTCGNPRFLRYVLERGAAMNVPGPVLEAYRAAMEQAIGADIETAAAAAEEFARRNDARSARPANTDIEGYRMTEIRRDSAPSPDVASTRPLADGWGPLWVGLPAVGLLLAWRHLRRSAS